MDIQQPPPLPPDHPVGPPQPQPLVMQMAQAPLVAGVTQAEDVEALKRQQHVNEEMKTFLINHNGLPGMMQLPLQAQQVCEYPLSVWSAVRKCCTRVVVLSCYTSEGIIISSSRRVRHKFISLYLTST